MKKLSIIIPYYNGGKYTDELINTLAPQITDEVEVFLIDDGSEVPFSNPQPWLTVIKQPNGGVSAARNTGLNHATGEYIAFIDSDDLVEPYYIEKIINKIDKEHFDYLYMSWKSFGGWNTTTQIKSLEDEFPTWNLCVWNRVYKKSCIGDIRFNTKKLIAEDADFIREVQYNCNKKSFISNNMYLYRSNTPDSLTKKFNEGKLITGRVVYYFDKITPEMEYLLPEVKKINETQEVIIMTNHNEIPELKKYAMVTAPVAIKGTELRGQPTTLFKKITFNIDLKSDIVIYTKKTYSIGGIETFIYNFCLNLYDTYDIIILYEEMDKEQIKRLSPYARVIQNKPNLNIQCTNLLINRISDSTPKNIKYQKKIQFIHSCRLMKQWKAPLNNDLIVPVSNIVKDSFQEDIKDHPTKVIHNFTNIPIKTKKILHLVSATRLSFEKGGQRMEKLVTLLQKYNIPFIWLIFSNNKEKAEDIPGVFYMSPTLNIYDYIKDADYLVQLSDSEGFGFSIVESMMLGTPVLTTPIDILEEINFKEGVHGYKLPFDMSLTEEQIQQIYQKIPKCFYVYDNKPIKEQWKETLGLPNNQTQKKYVKLNITCDNYKLIKAKKNYTSLALNKKIVTGEILSVSPDRYNLLLSKGYIEPYLAD